MREGIAFIHDDVKDERYTLPHVLRVGDAAFRRRSVLRLRRLPAAPPWHLPAAASIFAMHGEVPVHPTAAMALPDLFRRISTLPQHVGSLINQV